MGETWRLVHPRTQFPSVCEERGVLEVSTAMFPLKLVERILSCLFLASGSLLATHGHLWLVDGPPCVSAHVG